jgi:hypothetical protein
VRVRPGRVGAIAVLGLILGAIFFMGLVFYTIFKPDFGIAYDITNPSQPFTFKKPGSHEVNPTEPEPDLSFNETLAALREGGCAFVEGEPDDLNPERCVFLSQKEFIETALDRKLVFLHDGEDAYTLYVPVKEGHVAQRWLK